jgi:hypothetical protein
MSEQLKTIPDEAARQIIENPGMKDPLEKLRTVDNMGDFFDKTNDLAVELYFQNPQIVSEEGVEVEKIERAVRHHDFKGTDPGSGEPYNRLLQAVSFKEQIARSIIKNVISTGENRLGLTDAEKPVLLANCEMGTAFDNLYMQFNEAIHHSPVEKKIRGMIQSDGKEKVIQGLINADMIGQSRNYMYALFQEKNSDIFPVPVSYAEMFPDSIGEIISVLDKLNDKLSVFRDAQSHSLHYYFLYLKKALSEKNISRHEEAWIRVEKAWMEIKAGCSLST